VLYERALAISEKVLGREHTAGHLNDLARVLRSQGDVVDARQLYERALVIWEKALGHEHPKTAIALNNLGLVLHEQGDLPGARLLHERALAINEKAFGSEDRRTIESGRLTADALDALGLSGEALELWKKYRRRWPR
jgi:tetratricopeptide (TPR) repeat protein